MPALAEAKSIVAQGGWLARQPRPWAEALLAQARLRDYAAGDTITALGDAPGGLHCVVKGLADVLIAPGPFPPQLASLARPRWWVGEAAVMSRTTRRLGLIARTDVRMLLVPESAVTALAAEAPETWRRIGEITTAHVDAALLQAASLASSDLKLRLAAVLSRLTGADALCDAVTELPLTREEIGEIAGLSRNTVGRLLAELARDGIIKARYGRLVIVDPEGLAALARA